MSKIKFSAIFLLLGLVGCIDNDIPYPIKKANILEIAFSGQKSVEIDVNERIVIVELEDTTNIQNVAITRFIVTENTDVTPSIEELPLSLNLENDQFFLLSTYQDYKWTIRATRSISRSANVVGQVGKALFDTNNKNVIIYISKSTDNKNVTVQDIVFGPKENTTVYPDPKTVTDFSSPVQFTVTQHGRSQVWTVNMFESPSTVITNSPLEVWAKKAVLSGSIEVKAGVAGEIAVGFEYKKVSDSDYQRITGENIIHDEGNISTTIAIEPDTKYLYRVFQGEDVGADVVFTSEKTPTIPNLSFEDWYQIKDTWYPCLESQWGEKEAYAGFWNTGNSGVKTAGKSSNVTPVKENGGTVACLETVGDVMLVGMAAGNLFVGNFITNLVEPLTSPKFGRPFTGRPTKLIGKYKYLPKVINFVSSNHPDKEIYRGQMDRAFMWITLEDWGEGVTTRPATPKTIARAEYRELNTVSDYREFELILDYKGDKNTTPTHICIVFAASEFGDFYTGGAGTKLYIDDLQLVY